MNKLKLFVGLLPHEHKIESVMEGFDSCMIFSDDKVFDYVYDISEADIVAIFYKQNLESDLLKISKLAPNIKMLVDHTHMDHIDQCSRKDSDHNAQAIADCNSADNGIAPIVSFTMDYYGPRQRLNSMYFCDYGINIYQNMFFKQPKQIFKDKHQVNKADLKKRHWYPKYFDKSTYELENIYDQVLYTDFGNTQEQLSKSYIAPCKVRYPHTYNSDLTAFDDSTNDYQERLRTDNTRDFLRTELSKMLRNYPGFLSDPVSGHPLLGQDVLADSHHVLSNLESQLSWTKVESNKPIHNYYYKYSTLSIFLESQVLQRSRTDEITPRHVTEKTWFPIIKGHFILPFATPNFVQELQDTYRLKFPDWIDYSYEHELNDANRWSLYIREVKRLLNLGSDNLFELKKKDVEILQHNREVAQNFDGRPYPQLIDFCKHWSDRYPDLNNILDILTTM